MIIQKFIKWFEKHSDELPRHIARQLLQLNAIKDFCNYFPTCEGCPFKEEYQGCLFRGKIPREW